MLFCKQTSCSFIPPLLLSTDSDGIDFEEFVTIMVNYLQDPQEEEQELREAFQVMIRNLLIHQYYVYQSVLSYKGRRQKSSVASGDFLQRMTNVGW